MKPKRKSYNCRYISNGTIYACRIKAASPYAAAAIMKALPWEQGCGPIGLPRRHHPRLNRVMNHAAAWLSRRIANALPVLSAASHRLTPLIR